jgi:hypothetical protein
MRPKDLQTKEYCKKDLKMLKNKEQAGRDESE